MPRECRINFSWFNAESTNLHLLVGTTSIFQIVAVDTTGDAVHRTGPAQWRAKIGKIPVAIA